MARLNIIGEGSTEESFVRLVLAPFLGEHGVYAVARSVETSRRRSVIRRLIDIFPRYQKATDGIRVAERVGIGRLREECAHFNDWISRLMSLPSNQSMQAKHRSRET